jgi:hypothetical protein
MRVPKPFFGFGFQAGTIFFFREDGFWVKVAGWRTLILRIKK